MSDTIMPTACTHARPTARKDHRCCECRGIIRKGEQYQLVSGIWDGAPGRFKTCSDCESLRDEYNKPLRIEDTAPFEGLLEFLRESGETDMVLRFTAIRVKRAAKEVADV